ncbi:MAG: AAA family ATPase [Ruminococcus sp.]|nr:AAA family ATPase [Alphaproteobacteria bacterium]MBQ8692516.1 AAA family ATPase [Synergistaceae bacterium]MBR1602888.1 AAA family ATPase [Synergistaceae bacterium]MBR1731576.1 AAA family ATPase [Ruminococcus sp.]
MDRERAKIELKTYLKEYLETKHGIDTSKNFRCLSPQHEDKHPSMGFDAAHNQAHCFSCNENYDILELIQQDYNCDFNKALKIGCEMYHIPLDEQAATGTAQTNSAPVRDNTGKQSKGKPSLEDLKRAFDEARQANNDHPYLKAKQVRTDKTLKVNQKGELLIDLYDVDGNFKGYQRIADKPTKKTDKDTGREVEKWEKRQAFGTVQTGTFHVIGGYELTSRDIIILCEGYATAFSVWECIRDKARIVFALNCGNLSEVTRAIHNKYGIKPFIAADIDKDGREAAAKCREDICSGHVLPPFNKSDIDAGYTDWNEYFTKYGQDETTAALMDKLNKPELLPIDREEQPESAETELDINDYYIEFGERKNVKQIDMIGGLFPRGKISALIAPPGTGKTWFILYLSMYFSRGGGLEEPLLSRFPINRPYKSMILSGEGGYDELIGRSDNTGWRYDRQYLGVVDLNELIENDVLLSLTQEKGRRNLERLIDKRQPDIIFFDSLMAFSDYDENKSKEMGELMKYLMQTARINDIAVVPVHHTRKRKLNEQKAAQIMDEMIGSSMMQRYTRRIIGLQPKGQMIVEEVTGDEPVIVRDLKNNLTKKFKPFTFCIATDEDTNKLDMEFEFEPDLTFKAPDKKSEILHYIQEHYEEGDDRFTRADLEQVFTAKSTLQRILKELVETGKLGRCGTTKDAEYFLRPEIED